MVKRPANPLTDPPANPPTDRPPTPTATTPTQSSELRYALAAKAAGCPRNQIENFMRAGIVLQPVQLAFASACRQCDHPDGPTEIGFGGARMGGKSHAMVSILGADDCVRHAGIKCLLLRKVGTSGRESFEALLPKTIGRLGTYGRTDSMFRFPNGSWIKLGHFQNESDVDKYLGLEYDVIAVEEATTLSAFRKQAIKSCCRSPEGSGWRARMYNSTNPGGVGHAWYKQQFVVPFRNGRQTETRFIPSTVDDNRFATKDYRKFLDGLTGWLKQAWRYGDWDIAAGQFFTTFRRDVHVLKERPEIPENWTVWLGFDYGWTHYTCCHVFAQSGDGVVYAIGEHCERRWLPERHAVAIFNLIKRLGIPPERIANVLAGPDVFSKRQNGGNVAEDYRAHGLKMVPANNDRIAGAAEFLRRLGDPSADEPIEPTLFFAPECSRLIECIPTLEHDPHRPEDVLKIDADDDGLGGDDCFVAGTPVETDQGPVLIERIKSGDMLLTRAGYRPVVACWQSHRAARVLTLKLSDGREITGTPNHPIWVPGKGFTALESLKQGDPVLTCQQPLSGRKPSSSTATSSVVTRTRNGHTCGTTFGLRATIEIGASGPCTWKSGRRHTEPFRKGTTSITRMAIRSTTILRTWLASHQKRTLRPISSRLSEWSGLASISPISDRSPVHGMVRMRARNGIAGTPLRSGKTGSLKQGLASNARPFIRPSIAASLDSVRSSARPNPAANRELITRPDSVLSVERRLLSAGSLTRHVAPVHVLTVIEAGRADTFAIHVAEHHEYYANGILVKNCYDAARYALMGARGRRVLKVL